MRSPIRPRNEPRSIVPRHSESRRLNRKRAPIRKSGQRAETCSLASVRRSLETEAPYLLALHRSATITSFGNNAWFYRDAAKYFLSNATQQVTRLMDLPELDHRPDEHAHSCAQRMLVRLNDLHFSVPPSDVYADPDGAIRLLWSKEGRNAELVFPSGETEAPYIYHSDDCEYGVEATLNAESVLSWLNWVLNNIKPEHVRAA